MAVSPLFGDAFFEEVCLGVDNRETRGRMVSAVGAMADELAEAVRREVPGATVVLDEDGFVVSLPLGSAESVLSSEYGERLGDVARPVLRNALRGAAPRAEKAFRETVGLA